MRRHLTSFFIVLLGAVAFVPFSAHAQSQEVGYEVPAPRSSVSRPKFFYVHAGAGYSAANLLRLNSENFTDDPQLLSDRGVLFHGGVGLKLAILRVGLHGSYAPYTAFRIATAQVAAKLTIPIPLIQPYIRTAIGYAHIGNVRVTESGAGAFEARVRGMAVDAGAGIDISFGDTFQLGFGFDARFLNLKRQPATEVGSLTDVDFTEKGNSVGLQLIGDVHITLNF